MSASSIQKLAATSIQNLEKSVQNVATQVGNFADTLANLGNLSRLSVDEIKGFFASNPSEQEIATQAAAYGLNVDQITNAMKTAGFGGDDLAALKSQIEQFAANPDSGYTWNASGALISDKATPQSTTTSTAIALPAVQDIKSFYATNPNEVQVTAKIKALGLSSAQMVQFEAIGAGIDINKISSPVLESMYVDAASRLGEDIGGGKNGGWTSYFSPTLGRAVTKSEIQDFFATSPTQSQIFQKAAGLGLSVSAINNMMVGIGMNTTQAATNVSYNQMNNALFQGKYGYSTDQFGHIVSGGGNQFVLNAAGTSGSWVPLSPSGSTVNTTA